MPRGCPYRADGPKTTLAESQSAKVHVDLAALHFFDPETGESLRAQS